MTSDSAAQGSHARATICLTQSARMHFDSQRCLDGSEFTQESGNLLEPSNGGDRLPARRTERRAPLLGGVIERSSGRGIDSGFGLCPDLTQLVIIVVLNLSPSPSP